MDKIVGTLPGHKKRVRATLGFLLLLIFSLVAHADETIKALFHDANDPTLGNPSGKVTIVEFFDYQCMHCSNMAPKFETILKSNPNVKLVLKDYPIRGEMSLYAAQAALAAKMQGKYKELYFALLTSDNDLTKESVMDIAKNQGLNIDKLKKDMSSDTVQKQIERTSDLASFLEIPGTPAIFIGKSDAAQPKEIVYVAGEMSTKDMQDAITNAK